MKKIKYKVALIQLKIDTDPNKNLNTSIEKIKEAKSNDADLVCLPELFLTRYFCQSEDPNNFDYAEAIPGATTDALSKVAKENRIVVIAPVFEKRALGIYHNSCTVIDADGEIKGVYRKMQACKGKFISYAFIIAVDDVRYLPGMCNRTLAVVSMVTFEIFRVLGNCLGKFLRFLYNLLH